MTEPLEKEGNIAGEGQAGGKVILLGEHAVLYGHPALVAGIGPGVRTRVRPRSAGSGSWLRIPAWSVDRPLDPGERLGRAVQALLDATGLTAGSWAVEAEAELPARMGLGSSAALCVALARALLRLRGEALEPGRVERLALLGEQCFHGRASGVDVAAASRGGLLFFRPGQPPETLALPWPRPVLLALTSPGPPTAELVELVAAARRREPGRVDGMLARLGELTLAARQALLLDDRPGLGTLLGQAHALLVALGLGTPEIERAVATALAAGARGAKLSGAGGGGVVLVLPGERTEDQAAALRQAGFSVLATEIR